MPAIFINLDAREDRHIETVCELKSIGIAPDRIHRLSATARPDGAEGCTESHIRAQMWSEQQSAPFVLIVEDDLSFLKAVTVSQRIHYALQQKPDLDMLLIGTNAGQYMPTDIPGLYTVRDSQTTSGYIVRTGYLPVLLANFQAGLEHYRRTRSKPHHACDMFWKQLQITNRWYTLLEPRTAVQRPGYSDVEKCFVHYNC